MDEFKKSIQSVLYERISSPLSGAFALSWLIWNWKTLYVLILGTGFDKVQDKFSYIDANYINITNILIYPILSTIFFIFIYPFASTGVFWFWLRIKKWQSDIKNNIEEQKLISQEKYITLRLDMKRQNDKFYDILKEKEDEILKLNKEINDARSFVKEEVSQQLDISEKEKWDEGLKELLKFDLAELAKIVERTSLGYSLLGNVDDRLLSYFTTNDLIKMNGRNGELTEKGKYFAKEILKRNT